MLDSIGREHEDAAAFITVCVCGQKMITHNLSGELKFNEHGWGVWSYRHQRWCHVKEASDLKWYSIPLPGADGNRIWADICHWFEDDDDDKPFLLWSGWNLFDRGLSDKLLVSEARDWDFVKEVLIKSTPWDGGPETEADFIFLELIAEEVAVIDERVTVKYPYVERTLVEDFLQKKVSFSDLRAAIR